MKLKSVSAALAQFPSFGEGLATRNPEVANRRGNQSSVDSILQRTDPRQRYSNDLVEVGIQDSITAMEAAETALAKKERDLIRLRSEIVERERVVRETELLLDARSRLLDDQKALLDSRQSASNTPEADVAALEKALKDMEEALDIANDAILDKEQYITNLREQTDNLKSQLENKEVQPAPEESTGPITYESVTHPSLSEQVAFLREREAFIEQSENTLFDKAQELQEWETRLNQQKDDQESTAASAPSNSEAAG